MPVSSIRTIRSTSLSSASASCSSTARLTSDLDLDAVADRHLVDEAAEVPLQLGDPGHQLIAAALQVDDELLLGAALGRSFADRIPR